MTPGPPKIQPRTRNWAKRCPSLAWVPIVLSTDREKTRRATMLTSLPTPAHQRKAHNVEMWPSACRCTTTCPAAPPTSTRTRKPLALRDHTRTARASAASWPMPSSPRASRTAAATSGATCPWAKASRGSSTSRPPGQAREGCRAELACRRPLGEACGRSPAPGTQDSLRTTPAVRRQAPPLGQPAQTSLSMPQRSPPRRKRPKPPLAHFGPQEFLKVQYGRPDARSTPQPTSSMQWPPAFGEPSVLL
mmetsp:Transcript_74338/g.227447  ORF Transcript_74338/g.227447 Transcript_74338/m.227447 type:complete len:248 (-) Transcript_74338:254-997(-)